MLESELYRQAKIEADKALEVAIEARKKCGVGQFMLAKTFEDANMYIEALEWYREAIKSDEGNEVYQKSYQDFMKRMGLAQVVREEKLKELLG